MKAIIFVFLLFSMSISTAFGLKSPFEKKLQTFRYSLNEELSRMSYKDLTDLDFSDKTVLKIQNFLSDNAADIKKYKLELLSKEQVNKISVLSDQYKEVDHEDTDIHNMLESILGYTKHTQVLKLMTINPFYMPGMMQSFFLSRTMGPQEMADYYLKRRISQALIYTQDLGQDQWRILVDEYDYLFLFEYDLEKDLYQLISIYQREK